MKFLSTTAAPIGSLAVLALLAGCASSPSMVQGDAEQTQQSGTASSESDSALENGESSDSAVPEEEHTHDGDVADHTHDDEVGGTDAVISSAASYLADYQLVDDAFGTITTVTLTESSREIVTNALPNHQTGEFPNSGNPNAISAQDNSWSFPLVPNYTGQAANVKVTGVALNGVKFDPNTAERVTCASGEVYNLEALQDVSDLGLDFNNAHVQPGGEYHYHGVSSLLVDIYDQGSDLVLVGFAADGHLIYYSKSNAYQSSYRITSQERAGTDCVYETPLGGANQEFGSTPDGSLAQDWVFSSSYGDLDQCNGTFVDGQYVYVLTDSYPYIPRCLMGEFTEDTTPPAMGGTGDLQPPSDGLLPAPPPSEGSLPAPPPGNRTPPQP